MLNIIALNANHNVRQYLVRQEAKTNTTENALKGVSERVESLKKEKTTIESSLRETRQSAENLTKENQSLKVSLQNKREAKAAEEKKAQEVKAQQVAQAKEAAKKTTAPVVAQSVQTANAPAGCQAINSILLANGISQADLPFALQIAQKESSCNPNAVNPNGGACAYFQELPCGKWGGTGNIAGHIRGADAYAKNRYGGWAQAWASWQSKRWW